MILISAPSFGAETTLDPRAAQGAIKALNIAIAGNPYDVRLYTRRGNIYASMGQYYNAAKDLAIQCQLSATAEAKELCEAELKEFKKDHRLPK